MTNMNGHESTNGQSHYATNGFHVLPIDEPTSAGLTKQQLVILQHLQKGESITPWKAKYEYRCESLHGVISVLRKHGWDIQTYRCKDKAGKRFPSYRLRGAYTKTDQEESPAPLFDDEPQAPDPIADLLPIAAEPAELNLEPQAQEREMPGRQTRVATLDVIKEHLLAGKTISEQEAMDLYGVTGGALTAAISRLRKKENWQIVSIRVPDDRNPRRCIYGLGKPGDDTETRKSVTDREPDEAGGKSATACRYAVGSTPTSNISFNFGKDGPELRLIGEGESEDRPFCRIDPKNLQILSMFVQMAGGK